MGFTRIQLLLLNITCCSFYFSHGSTNPCDLVATANGGGYCKCTSTYCDTIEDLGQVEDNIAIVYTTSKSGDRLKRSVVPLGSLSNSSNDYYCGDTHFDAEYELNINKKYQEILGFGGAITDAVALTLRHLPLNLQNQILHAYYDSKGLKYTLGRFNMASCDFSLKQYSYNDVPHDYNMSRFSIAMDEDVEETGNKLDYLKQIQNLVNSYSENEMIWYASPWQAPLWMMENNRATHNSRMLNKEKIKKSWALYFSRFLTEYNKKGISIWGITIQNEPFGNSGIWQTIQYTPQDMLHFIKNYVGPQLRQDHPHVKILMLDDQRSHMDTWTDVILKDPQGERYIDGIAVHWYDALWTPVEHPNLPFQKMAETHHKYPSKFILPTEACNGFLAIIDQGPDLGSFTRGETYGYDIIQDLLNYAVGWTDWNIVLDLNGGPNWAKNFVDSPILVNTTSKNEFYKQPMYYFLGHFSKFLPKRSIRIDSKNPNGLIDGLASISFLTPQDHLVTIVMNKGDKHRTFVLKYKEKQTKFDIEPHSIQTIVIKK